jgi:periplasmic protein TonB
VFRENLLESSPHQQNRKRWPMAAAFILESIAATLVIVVPLFSTGVIPVGAANIPRIIVSLPAVRVAREAPRAAPRPGSSVPSASRVVVLADNQSRIYMGPARERGVDDPLDPDLPPGPAGPAPDVSCVKCAGPAVVPGPAGGEKPYIVSRLSPAQLLYRVEPVYPPPAVLMGLQGEVKLHALIAKDGTIQSLKITSGHPLLAQAALAAVRQWRYRPYVLNGLTVEVETFITVNFKRDR